MTHSNPDFFRQTTMAEPDEPEPLHLPTELELKIFQELDFVGLIKASGVCTRWRELISVSGVVDPPERHTLLQLYKDTVASPTFLRGRASLLERLNPDFDRHKYIQDLQNACKKYALPKEFTTWILDWPGRACQKYWPGLQHSPSPAGYSWLSEPDPIRLIGPGVVPVRQPVHYEGPEAGGGGLIMEDLDKEVMTMVVWTSSHDGVTFLIIGDCEERYGEVDEFVIRV